MKYLYLFGAILLIVVIRMTVVGPEAVDEGGHSATVKATADTFVPSSTAPASSPGFAPFTGDEATVVTARDEQAFDPNRESRGTATPAPTTATVVSTRTDAREALTVEPTVSLEGGGDGAALPDVVATIQPEQPEAWYGRSTTPTSLQAAIEAAFPPHHWATAYRVAMCESGGNPGAVGAAGEQGAFQVLARYHGPVPADLYGQAAQAARIVAAHGWGPRSCH